jgi:hypothetical protein
MPCLQNLSISNTSTKSLGPWSFGENSLDRPFAHYLFGGKNGILVPILAVTTETSVMREYWYERQLVLEYFRLRVVDPDGRPNFHGMGVADKQQKNLGKRFLVANYLLVYYTASFSPQWKAATTGGPRPQNEPQDHQQDCAG